MTAKTIKVFDSLRLGEAHKIFGEQVFKYILLQHQHHYGTPMSQDEQNGWTRTDAKGHVYSYQQNGIDCGVCVLQYFYLQLMGRAPFFTLQQTNEFRNAIARSLLVNKLIEVTEEQQHGGSQQQGGSSSQQQAANQTSASGANDQTSSARSGKTIKVTYLATHCNGRFKDKIVQTAQDISVQFDTAATRRGERPQTHLIYVQDQEWCRLVVRETTNQYNNNNCIKPSELVDNMKLLVLPEDPQGPLGPPLLLSVQATVLGQSILLGTRVIRGRGDCFFRALIYSILEQIIINPRARQNMATFRDMLIEETAHIPRPNDKQRIRRALQMLTTGPDETCASIHNLAIQVADEQNGLDRALIQLTRNIIHQYVAASKDEYFDDGKTIQEMFETYQETGKTYEQQLHDIITKSPEGLGMDASDQLVYSGLPFAAFRVQCDMLTPMKAERGKGDYRTERINSLRYPIATVALICKHIHYDIAYVRKMNETEQFRMKHPGIQRGMTEAEQPTSEEEDNSAQQNNSNSHTTSDQDDGRPHEASAQQNRDYLIPGD